MPTSNLYHVKVPDQFANRKYSNLFDFLTTNRSMIPIGLYRCQKVNYDHFKDEEDRRGVAGSQYRQTGGATNQEKLKEIRYVITNP